MKRHLLHSFCLGVAAMATAPVALPYAATAVVDFRFGGNHGATPGRLSHFERPSPRADVMWVPNDTLDSVDNGTYFTESAGYSAFGYYNSNFMTPARCSELALYYGTYGQTVVARKYGCQDTTYAGDRVMLLDFAEDDFPVGGATGTLTVTDTTLTGVLQIVSTTDEPTGTATRMAANGMRLSVTASNGTDGYNYRSHDGTLYGNSWYGITTAATLTVNLTGTFTATDWTIDGGTVRFTDPGFACQQSGYGGTDLAGLLCTPGTNAGGLQPDGGNLSWGQDPDGAGPRTDTAEIEIRHTQTGEVIERLSGVLASLSVQGDQLVTNRGEFRRAYSIAGAASCNGQVHYDPALKRVTCASLVAGLLDIRGAVTVVPLPATAGLMALSLGLLHRFTRRRAATMPRRC